MDLALKGIATVASGLGAVMSVRQHANLIVHQFASCQTMADYPTVWWSLDEANFLAVNTAAFLIVIASLSGTLFLLGVAARIRKLFRKRREHAGAREKANKPASPAVRSRKKSRPKPATREKKKTTASRAAS